MTKARVNADNASADIQGVTAGTGLSGGGTSGTVTLTNDMATAIDAKGDLVVGTGADTYDNLAVGNNGETLVADSAATTGLRYSATPSASNPVLNSAMQVWQRGTSFSLAASSGVIYTADRWATSTNANQACTIARQATGDTTNLPNIQYAMRYQRNSGQTGTGLLLTTQSLETINSIPFAGKTITISFYARAGANFSSTSSILVNYFMTGTGTDQNRQSGAYTGEVTGNNNATLTTTWQRFSYTYSVAATATEIATGFAYTPVGTASTNDYYEVTGVQVDVGSVALPFRTYAATIQGELAACQRYYFQLATGNTMPIGSAFNNSATLMRGLIAFPVTMRTGPTLSSATGTSYYIYRSASSDDYFNSLTIGDWSTTCATVYNNTEISGTAGYGGYILTNNASASVAFSAEL